MQRKATGTRFFALTPTRFFVLALLFIHPAVADLISAQTAYAKGDFTTAFNDYRQLAEIGQPTAQFDLAVMYARGEAVRQSDINAYAWASLAAQNGLEKAGAMADRLRPLLAPGSEKIAADIAAQFGNAVLDARLNPRIIESDGANQDNRHRCFPTHTYMPPYPQGAQIRGVEGQVYVEFSLMPDGRSRMPRIIYAVPSGMFESAVRESLLKSEFAGAPESQQPIPCTMFFRFIYNQGTGDYSLLDRFVRETRKRAEGGDPGSQALYGMLLVGLPQLHQPRSAALPWFLKSAQAGVPMA